MNSYMIQSLISNPHKKKNISNYIIEQLNQNMVLELTLIILVIDKRFPMRLMKLRVQGLSLRSLLLGPM